MGGIFSRRDSQDEVDQLMSILENKREEFVSRIEATRGNLSHTEVRGGRTVMRQSEIRCKTGGSAGSNVGKALLDFMKLAQGGQTPKNAAIQGAMNMITSGLDNLFTAAEGTGMEKQGFCILFMNYAFVRVDYLVYTFSSKGKWSDRDSKAGACYVADLAVLNPADLTASEIDFLLGQALAMPSPTPGGVGDAMVGDLELIMQTKIMLVQSAILSRMLSKEDIVFKDLETITDKLAASQKKIKSTFDKLKDASE